MCQRCIGDGPEQLTHNHRMLSRGVNFELPYGMKRLFQI